MEHSAWSKFSPRNELGRKCYSTLAYACQLKIECPSSAEVDDDPPDLSTDDEEAATTNDAEETTRNVDEGSTEKDEEKQRETTSWNRRRTTKKNQRKITIKKRRRTITEKQREAMRNKRQTTAKARHNYWNNFQQLRLTSTSAPGPYGEAAGKDAPSTIPRVELSDLEYESGTTQNFLRRAHEGVCFVQTVEC